MKKYHDPLENASIELACGSVAEEINDQKMVDEVVGGYDSPALGNEGSHCSVTLECQNICSWVNWSGWGFWC